MPSQCLRCPFPLLLWRRGPGRGGLYSEIPLSLLCLRRPCPRWLFPLLLWRRGLGRGGLYSENPFSSHYASGGRGSFSFFGARSLFSVTGMPLRNLNPPALTTF